MSVGLARQKAEHLVQENGLTQPPIDVEKIASRLRLPIVRADLGGEVSGLLITKRGAASICVHQDHHPNRQRFTIAHEIAHFILGHHNQPGEHVHVDHGNYITQRGPRAAKGIDLREIEANQFAASLLMPSEMLEAHVRKAARGALHDGHVVDLASRFEVSEQAMTIRLASLGFL